MDKPRRPEQSDAPERSGSSHYQKTLGHLAGKNRGVDVTYYDNTRLGDVFHTLGKVAQFVEDPIADLSARVQDKAVDVLKKYTNLGDA